MSKDHKTSTFLLLIFIIIIIFTAIQLFKKSFKETLKKIKLEMQGPESQAFDI